MRTWLVLVVLLAGCSAPAAPAPSDAQSSAPAVWMTDPECVVAAWDDPTAYKVFSARWPIAPRRPGLPVSRPDLDEQFGPGHWSLVAVEWRAESNRATVSLRPPWQHDARTAVHAAWSPMHEDEMHAGLLAFIHLLAPATDQATAEAVWQEVAASPNRTAAMPLPMALDGPYERWQSGMPLPNGTWDFIFDVSFVFFSELVEGFRVEGHVTPAGAVDVRFYADGHGWNMSLPHAQDIWQSVWAGGPWAVHVLPTPTLRNATVGPCLLYAELEGYNHPPIVGVSRNAES